MSRKVTLMHWWSGYRAVGCRAEKRITGLTYKDDTTLARFDRAGFRNTYRYDPGLDLGVAIVRRPGNNTTRARRRSNIDTHCTARSCGSSDRSHVLEHAPRSCVRSGNPRQIDDTGGYLVIEVPDCTKFVDACDYSFVWEEHITYFSSKHWPP
jgi:hypothetical protein